MKKINTSDINAFGILLIGIFIFKLSLMQSMIYQIIGIIGGISVVIAESIFLWQKFTKNEKKQ